MIPVEGKFTVETFAKEKGLSRQSAINLISKLKKRGYVETTGGGKQKRIYTIYKTPRRKSNGFYSVINKYSANKLNPKFEHIVIGNYTIEHAIIDGIEIGDVRTLDATTNLFRHVKNWKRLFELAKKHELTNEVRALYRKALTKTRCKRMPKVYKND